MLQTKAVKKYKSYGQSMKTYAQVLGLNENEKQDNRKDINELSSELKNKADDEKSNKSNDHSMLMKNVLSTLTQQLCKIIETVASISKNFVTDEKQTNEL